MALTREEIVRAATRIAGERGVEALSMRKVAAELGVSPMALYNHIENREDLVGSIVESFLRWVTSADDGVGGHAARLLAGYRRWPYLIDLVRESRAGDGVVDEALEAEVAAGADAARVRESWVVLSAVAGALATAGDDVADGDATLARVAAALEVAP